MNSPQVQIGLSRSVEDQAGLLRRKTFGLVLNQASVSEGLKLSCDVLAQRFPGQLKALFSPQHGLWSEEQANMIESPDAWYEPLNVPVHSLYSDTRRPTPEMLENLDVLIIDLQDVGTRVYTFVWTMLECLHACAEAGIAVVVLDRPNPLGGSIVEGPVLNTDYRSFVGNAETPMRHGLTMGELAKLMFAEQTIDVDLHVVSMTGWCRNAMFPETGLPWVGPSPNMPTFSTAVLYPGQVLLEGTNLSEGRGTATPFEVVGAPFLNSFELCDRLNLLELPGVRFRAVRFRPTFEKWQDQICHGVAVCITDSAAVRSVRMTLNVLKIVSELAGQQFAFQAPPYEYEYQRPPIDILFGSDRLRMAMESATDWDCDVMAKCDEELWRDRCSNFLLYQ